jgi:hypothetical protein
MLTVRQAQRRYLGLLALRNAATGLVMPVQMLLYAARGLDLPTVGLLVALYSGLIVLLELPTGGLADLLGAGPRRAPWPARSGPCPARSPTAYDWPGATR